MAAALKSRGRIFVQTTSPFVGHFRRFASDYERRKAAGVDWPGEMTARDYAEPAVLEMTPSFMHLLEAPLVRWLFERAGFVVESCDYYRRPGLPEVCWLDGRENLGIVAIKP
jgi:hypothetical protein